MNLLRDIVRCLTTDLWAESLMALAVMSLLVYVIILCYVI